MGTITLDTRNKLFPANKQILIQTCEMSDKGRPFMIVLVEAKGYASIDEFKADDGTIQRKNYQLEMRNLKDVAEKQSLVIFIIKLDTCSDVTILHPDPNFYDFAAYDDELTTLRLGETYKNWAIRIMDAWDGREKV